MKIAPKQGNIIDIIFILVIFFAIAISLTSIFNVFHDIKLDIGNNTRVDERTRNTITTADNNIPRVMDTMFVTAFFGAFISIAGAAFFIRSNAMFFFVAVIIIAVFVFIAAHFSNIFEDYRQNEPEMERYIESRFPFSVHIMDNWALYTTVMSFMVLIALFAKTSGNVGTGV